MNDIDGSLFPALTALELGKILNRWREPHRRWHGLGHLATLLVAIELESHMSESDREMLRYVALFHDSIYAPMRGDNEEESAQLAIFYLRKYPRQDEVIAAILERRTIAPSTCYRANSVRGIAPSSPRKTGRSCLITRKRLRSSTRISRRKNIAARASVSCAAPRSSIATRT